MHTRTIASGAGVSCRRSGKGWLNDQNAEFEIVGAVGTAADGARPAVRRRQTATSRGARMRSTVRNRAPAFRGSYATTVRSTCAGQREGAGHGELERLRGHEVGVLCRDRGILYRLTKVGSGRRAGFRSPAHQCRKGGQQEEEYECRLLHFAGFSVTKLA